MTFSRNTLDRNPLHNIGMSDEERHQIERGSYDFHRETGGQMRVPPKLFMDLKRLGVDMRYIMPDPSLDPNPENN